jgi:probable addiction module antidote protein
METVKTGTVKTRVWDPAEYLETEEEISAYLAEVSAIGDPDLIIAAEGDVARARAMANAKRGDGRLEMSMAARFAG